MGITRIKIKIGQHEFEAEGPVEVVQSQFDTFKILIAAAPQQISETPKESPKADTDIEADIQLDKICKVEGRVVSLTIKPDSETVASMLIMLGQKAYRDNDTVTVSEIKDGLEQSGYRRTTRLDRIMQPLTDDASVVKIGARKGTRYRFTNQGIAKAQAAAREATSTVP